MSKKRTNILVTGGAGFIGSHVVEELMKENCKVTVIDDLSGGFIENIPDTVEFVKGSILDVKLLEKII